MTSPFNEKVRTRISHISCHLKLWHQDQNKRLRSEDDHEQWIIEQVGNDKYFDHINQMVINFGSSAHLQKMSCVVSNDAAERLDKSEALVDDELADIECVFTWSLVANRCRRGEWMFGYPNILFKLLVGGDQAQKAVSQMRLDMDVYQEFSKFDVASDVVARAQGRRQFLLRCNKQFMEAFTELGWDFHGEATHGDLLKLLRTRARLPWASQVCEDVLGSMKNQRGPKTRLYRKPETVFANAIKGKTLQQRHRFKPVILDRPLKKKMHRLPMAAFKANHKHSIAQVRCDCRQGWQDAVVLAERHKPHDSLRRLGCSPRVSRSLREIGRFMAGRYVCGQASLCVSPQRLHQK